MPATPTDEADVYRAAIHHTWATGRRPRGGHLPSLDGDARDRGTPAGASDCFLLGWRAGIDAAAW